MLVSLRGSLKILLLRSHLRILIELVLSEVQVLVLENENLSGLLKHATRVESFCIFEILKP